MTPEEEEEEEEVVLASAAADSRASSILTLFAWSGVRPSSDTISEVVRPASTLPSTTFARTAAPSLAGSPTVRNIKTTSSTLSGRDVSGGSGGSGGGD